MARRHHRDYRPEPFQKIPHPRVKGALVLVPEVILAPGIRDCDQPWGDSRILNFLRALEGRAATIRDLAEAYAGGNPEGGPEASLKTVGQYIWRLRRKGYPIEKIREGVYRYRWTEWETVQ